MVVAAFGRRYLVELEDGSVRSCLTRGKRSEVACGDKVRIRLSGSEDGVIETCDTRRNLIQRASTERHKLIAANVDLVAIVVSGEPLFSDEFVARGLAVAAQQEVPVVLLLCKADLAAPSALAQRRLQPLLDAGYPLVQIARSMPLGQLEVRLQRQRTVLVGQSGMGKSTLINRLIPSADARTAEISKALNSGRHTTTHARLYHLPQSGEIIDTPGVQEFGVKHLQRGELYLAFPEFARIDTRCRFSNCRHAGEPNCAWQAEVDKGAVLPERLAMYRKLAQAAG